jgi:hypothetical protein
MGIFAKIKFRVSHISKIGLRVLETGYLGGYLKVASGRRKLHKEEFHTSKA